MQLLIAKWQQATSWFNPELLRLPIATVRTWMDESPDLAVYRFAIEEVFRLQEHVLDQQGERLLSLSERLGSVPKDAYAALSTADARFPTITLSTGESTQVSYGQYRKLLATCRSQADRRAAYEALYDTYTASLNTYAAIYNGVMQGDWFEARSRGYKTTLDAALFGNAIPTSVVENLIREAKAGVAPFRRYHQLRKRVLGLADYYVFDAFVPLVDFQEHYKYDEVLEWIVEAVAPLGEDYQARVRTAFAGRWIDVYENQGKRSGAYSAPVYGANPYMLMNYNDTLDAVFTLAHELGHSMHTLLSHETQPFVYAGYTIFVAEVPSTLNEALLLDLMLARARTKEERIVLLQHAIDGIAGTFYNQVLFADFELEAHRLVEQRSADHVRNAQRDLLAAAGRVLGRRAVAGSARAAHLGAHPALLPVAVLRLSVRDLLCVNGEADGRDRQHGRRHADQGGGALPRSAALGRLGPSDGALEAGRCGSRAARHRARGSQAARRRWSTRLERELAAQGLGASRLVGLAAPPLVGLGPPGSWESAARAASWGRHSPRTSESEERARASDSYDERSEESHERRPVRRSAEGAKVEGPSPTQCGAL